MCWNINLITWASYTYHVELFFRNTWIKASPFLSSPCLARDFEHKQKNLFISSSFPPAQIIHLNSQSTECSKSPDIRACALILPRCLIRIQIPWCSISSMCVDRSIYLGTSSAIIWITLMRSLSLLPTRLLMPFSELSVWLRIIHQR